LFALKIRTGWQVPAPTVSRRLTLFFPAPLLFSREEGGDEFADLQMKSYLIFLSSTGNSF
jgi:hypothetical protein